MGYRMVLAAVTLGLCVQVASAQLREARVDETPAASSRSVWSDAGYGVLATVANVFYMPAKIVYAGVGLVTGSFAYVLTVGDDDAAQAIWSPSLGGTYVVTPAMFRGEEPILFSGASHFRQ